MLTISVCSGTSYSKIHEVLLPRTPLKCSHRDEIVNIIQKGHLHAFSVKPQHKLYEKMADASAGSSTYSVRFNLNCTTSCVRSPHNPSECERHWGSTRKHPSIIVSCLRNPRKSCPRITMDSDVCKIPQDVETLISVA